MSEDDRSSISWSEIRLFEILVLVCVLAISRQSAEHARQLPFKAWLRRAASGDRYPIDCAPRMVLASGRLASVGAQSRRNFGRSRKIVDFAA